MPRNITWWVRVLAGMAYLLNGLNWWVKIITPYPSMSDFVDFVPPPDVVGAMIENGVLFHLVKMSELIVGIALLANRFVPLALVIALPIAVPIFIVDVFFIAHLRGQIMGWGTLVLTFYLMISYLGSYHGILAPQSTPSAQTRGEGYSGQSQPARFLARAFGPLMLPLGGLSLVLGCAMVAWLFVMVGQHLIDPQPFASLFPLEPRER